MNDDTVIAPVNKINVWNDKQSKCENKLKSQVVKQRTNKKKKFKMFNVIIPH